MGGTVLEAVRKLGLKRVDVVTPFIDEINEVEKFLEHYGIGVINISL